MGSAWTDELEKRLLLSLIPAQDTISRARFNEAAVRLGHGLSWNGCRLSSQYLSHTTISSFIVFLNPLFDRSPLNVKSTASLSVKMPWTEREDLTLLLLILDLDVNISRAVFETAAVKMGCRTDQCRQKFYKLKKESEKLLGGGDTATTNAPTTPKTTKLKGENGTTGRATGGKRKKATTDQDADLGDTLSKKKAKPAPNEEVKLEPVAAGENKAVKVEESLEEED